MIHTINAVTSTTPGTPIALTPGVRTMADWVVLQSRITTASQTGNTGAVYTGDKTMTRANGQIILQGGGFLYPAIPGTTGYNLAEIYMDVDTSGDGVRVVYGRH